MLLNGEEGLSAIYEHDVIANISGRLKTVSNQNTVIVIAGNAYRESMKSLLQIHLSGDY
jgi:hypothetical protein